MTTDLLLLISLFEGTVGISTDNMHVDIIVHYFQFDDFVQSISECCAYFDDPYMHPFLDDRSVSQNLMQSLYNYLSNQFILC